MTLPIPPMILTVLQAGHITCPCCNRKLDEQDYFGEAVDELGEHTQFRCRICFPPTQPN